MIRARGSISTVLFFIVVVLTFTGCGALAGTAAGAKHHLRRVQRPPSATSKWNPVARQSFDAATTFLFDAAVARTQRPGNGGFIMGNAAGGDLPWQPDSKVQIVPGRYRLGIKSTTRDYGYLWMPGTGLLSSRAFTIEFWLKAGVPWRTIDAEDPVSVEGITFNLYGGYFAAEFQQTEAYPPINASLNTNVSSLPANAWENFALTYSHDQLILYVNGREVAAKGGFPVPQVWSDANRGGGLTIGGFDGQGATDLSVSDLRISRVQRVPGTPVRSVPALLDVGSRPTGARIRDSLLGGLHTLTTPATVRMARGVIRVIRTDKLINSTPIKVGAPDSAHPSRGVTGVYAYNWAVVDRTMRYLHQLGVQPYISLDATPQILGGPFPPFSGSALQGSRSYLAGFPPQVPDDLHAWQLIVEDLAFHILRQDHITVRYWGVWNEPDGSFWSGGLSQYLALYRASVTGVRAVDPYALVGGPETATLDPQWIIALIDYCASQHLPLNFVSWHYYSGDLEDIAEAENVVAAAAAHDHVPRPFINVGEWTWQLANVPGTGVLPFRDEDYFTNDWSAAFIGASLISMQRDDVQSSIFTNPVASENASGAAASGLMSPSHPWSNFNVYRLWNALRSHQVSTSLDADPGIFAVASKGRDVFTALVVSLHYQLGREYPLTVRFPRRLAGDRVRVWLIDRHHADATDAGVRHAQLKPVTRRLDSRAQVALAVPARAVLLIEAPPSRL